MSKPFLVIRLSVDEAIIEIGFRDFPTPQGKFCFAAMQQLPGWVVGRIVVRS